MPGSAVESAGAPRQARSAAVNGHSCATPMLTLGLGHGPVPVVAVKAEVPVAEAAELSVQVPGAGEVLAAAVAVVA